MNENRLNHPLATPAWESQPAATVRLHTRALWADPAPDEDNAPHRRIIHARAIMADEPMTLRRLTAGAAPGYHKCASGQERDAITDLRAFVPGPDGWREVGRAHAPASVALEEGLSVDLEGTSATAMLAVARRAATDEWWPGWNLVQTGLHLDAEVPDTWRPGPDGALRVESINTAGAPAGVDATVTATEVVFRTPTLAVGFRLTSPAWSHLGIDADGGGRVTRNLLQMPRSMDIVRAGVYPSGVYPVLRDQQAEYLAQGPRLTHIDGTMPVGFLHRDYEGTTTVRGSTVEYRVRVAGGTTYTYAFTVERDRIVLDVTRDQQSDVRAWTSSAWHVATDARVTPSTALGDTVRRGETGLIQGPLTWHFPRHGTLVAETTGDVLWRADAVRPLDTQTLELKVGEEPLPTGDYLVRAGSHHARVEWTVRSPRLARLAADTPAPVARAVERHALTALAYRADTDTYSNNGASMHCTTSTQDISAIAEHLDDAPGIRPMGWIGDSLQRWLDGAPSYGSGATSLGPHRLDDEYVHLAANTLVACARYARRDPAWCRANLPALEREITAMLDRDLDGDGLVESAVRRGVSGEHQWSTAWCDVISFGWKDAWANAVVFDAWTLWEPLLRDLDRTALADRIAEARAALASSYLPTFHHERTGLIAGWRSHDDSLHDHGFSLVNGAACRSDLLPVDAATEIMASLVREWDRAGLDDFRNGIPLNLWRIPEEDIGGVVFGLAMGCYQQGGYSHHGTSAVVDALWRVGDHVTAERVLTDLCTTIGDDTAFGGLGSGIDWRMADGTPSGYEGQLIEGFSVLSSALARYGVRPG